MTRKEFEAIVAEEFPVSVPEKFREKIHNVAFVVEDEPSLVVRRQQKASPNQTLLGLYHGIPRTARGESYGIGVTLPDVITLFQRPIEEEARGNRARVREVVRETIWHEVAHHFGLDEKEVSKREPTRRVVIKDSH